MGRSFCYWNRDDRQRIASLCGVLHVCAVCAPAMAACCHQLPAYYHYYYNLNAIACEQLLLLLIQLIIIKSKWNAKVIRMWIPRAHSLRCSPRCQCECGASTNLICLDKYESECVNCLRAPLFLRYLFKSKFSIFHWQWFGAGLVCMCTSQMQPRIQWAVHTKCHPGKRFVAGDDGGWLLP